MGIKMKSFRSIALFIALSQIISIAYTSTPKADGLADHFGTEPVKDVYGPHKNPKGFYLRREGVVAGDLTNASYDASKIIRPNLARPKAKITTTFNHEAIVKTPVHIGTDVQRITTRNMKSDHTTTVDMTTGKLIKGGEPKVKHG